MTTKSYGLIGPISKACDVLQARWTLPILCEMWAGESRFNEIRRAPGSISPSVLARRLSEMEAAGLVERIEDRSNGTVHYVHTQKAVGLEPALTALAAWAQCNIEAEAALSYDTPTLMWTLRRMDVSRIPIRRVVTRFHFSDEDGPHSTYWLLIRPGFPVEVCIDTPGFEVDLYVETTKASFGAVIMGWSTLTREEELGRLLVTGDPVLKRSLPDWFPRSRFTEVQGIAALPEPKQTAGMRSDRLATGAQARVIGELQTGSLSGPDRTEEPGVTASCVRFGLQAASMVLGDFPQGSRPASDDRPKTVGSVDATKTGVLVRPALRGGAGSHPIPPMDA